MKKIPLLRLTLLAVGSTSCLQAARPPGERKKIPYSDEIKHPPLGEYTWRLKNVWQPLAQPNSLGNQKEKQSMRVMAQRLTTRFAATPNES